MRAVAAAVGEGSRVGRVDRHSRAREKLRGQRASGSSWMGLEGPVAREAVEDDEEGAAIARQEGERTGQQQQREAARAEQTTGRAGQDRTTAQQQRA